MSEKWVVVEIDPGNWAEGPSVAEVHGFFDNESEANHWALRDVFTTFYTKRVRKAVQEKDEWA